ncbi:MAG: response regulator [Deltaproteobacteria bacterium]|nr:response regulator [Deltaproteobacteria bacterium]
MNQNDYRQMLEAITLPLYICSQDFDIEYMNPLLQQNLGRDLCGEKCYRAIHNFSAPCYWCPKNTGAGSRPLALEGVRNHHNNRLYNLSMSPVANEDGSISHLVIFRDVTNERKLENFLHQAQKMESIGNLAGGIAHDFNNILTVINLTAENLEMELADQPELKEEAEEIRLAGQRGAALTRQLLAFSRKQKITPQDLDLNQLVREMEKMLRRLIGENIVLETCLLQQPAQIYADPGQIEQVLVNLLINARDAVLANHESGKKTIRITTSTIELEDREGYDRAAGTYVKLEVGDNGCGIAAENLAKIFEPFFTTKPKGGGTGMGLAVVCGIVQQSHGLIEAESQPGRGTSMQIYWPRATEPAASDNLEAGDYQATVTAVSNNHKVVLLAEDEVNIRRVATRQLQREGLTVLEAENGMQALALAKSFSGRIDLLFTDIVMPEMGGKELAEAFRKTRPETPVLYTSGYNDPIIFATIIDKDGENFIQKPYNARELLAKIRNILINPDPSPS